MKLKNYINKSILEYPLLYKAKNYDRSRLLVLDHIFITNGNGLDIMELVNKPDEEIDIPDGYFETPIWRFQEDQFNQEVWEELKSNGFKPELLKKLRYGHCGEKEFILQCDIETAQKLYVDKFLDDIKELDEEIDIFRLPLESAAHEYDGFNYNPYPLCKYAKLYTILDGKEPFGGGEIDINQIPRDWIEGMQEVAKAYLDFLDSHVEFHQGYPTEKLLKQVREEKELEYYKEDMENYGVSDVEELFKMIWEKEEKWIRKQLNKALKL